MHADLAYQLKHLGKNCVLKRRRLQEASEYSDRNRRRLTLLAGILALLSAASITSLIAEFTSPLFTKILAGLFSTASGFVSLLVNVSLKEHDVEQMIGGASRYLELSHKCRNLLSDDTLAAAKVRSKIEELQTTYAELDGLFGRYMMRGLKTRGSPRSHDIAFIVASRGKGRSSPVFDSSSPFSDD